MAVFGNLFPNALELPEDRSVINRATHAHDGAAENTCVARIAGAHLLAGQLPYLRLKRALFRISQLTGGRNLCLGESHARIEFVPELLNDGIEKMHSAVINQDRHKVAHLPQQAFPPCNRVEHSTLLLSRDRRILPYAAQVAVRTQQRAEQMQLVQGFGRVQPAFEHHVCKRARVDAEDRGHQFLPPSSALPRRSAKLRTRLESVPEST